MMPTPKVEKKKVLTAAERLKKLNRQIQKDNKAFEKMKPEEKRVAIARDVLKSLKAKSIIPTHGTYFLHDKVVGGDRVMEKTFGKEDQVQSMLQNVKTCNVFALGSMMFCTVKKFNNMKVSEAISPSYGKLEEASGARVLNALTDGQASYDYLGKYFSNDQLEEIEGAFEGQDFHQPDHRNPDETLRLIMENIIANKGTFM